MKLTIFKWGLIGFVSLVGLGFVSNLLGVFSSATTATGRVIQRTLETDNIINNYEWYHDQYQAYVRKMGDIETHKKLLSEEESAAEKTRLRIELAGMRQVCRRLATQYNANATKTNRSIFMGREAPDSLDEAVCSN